MAEMGAKPPAPSIEERPLPILKPKRLNSRDGSKAEFKEYVEICVKCPGLSHLNATKVAASHGNEQLMAFALEDMQRNTKNVPAPIAGRVLPGNFQARMPAELHRSLTSKAA